MDIIDQVKNSIIADSKTHFRSIYQFATTCRTWVLCKRHNTGDDVLRHGYSPFVTVVVAGELLEA